MHVLKSIHQWLRPHGVTLDVHPQPEQPVVELMREDDAVYLGLIDNTSLIANIHRARATVESLVGEGWFSAWRSIVFDFRSHFPSVDDWLRYREERRSSSIVDPEIVARARELFSTCPGCELRVSERELATRLDRR